MKSIVSESLLAAVGLLGSAFLASAQVGSTSLGVGNTNVGNYSLASGGFNSIFGGYGNHALGWSHTIGTGSFNLLAGLQNVTAGNFNFITGLGNQPAGAFNLVGGQNNVGAGNQNLVFGNFLDFGSLAGSVIVSDSNPFSVRTTAARFTNTTADTFNGVFDAGYRLRVNSGQGATPNAGVFIIPSVANTATTSSPAFVGINKLVPTQALDVVGNGAITAATAARITVTSTTNLQSAGMHAVNTGQTWFVGIADDQDFRITDVNTGLTFINFCDAQTGTQAFVGLCGQTNAIFPVHVGTDTTNGNGARLTATGVWTDASSRTFKENFKAVDAAAVLKKVTELPVRTWNYKGVPDVLHMGPVAEDFRDMFGLGEDEKYLASLDTNGVALAAIQGLNEVVKEKDRKIQNLEDRLTKLEKLIQSTK